MSADSAPTQIRSIQRAAAILRLLSGSSRSLGVAELAKELSLPRGTIHGILRTLKREQLVEQDVDSSKYRLGETLLPMGFSYLEANALRAAALNSAHALASRTRETVRVGTLYEARVLIVHHVFRPDNSHQLSDIGSLQPAHATALGKALLSLDPYALGRVAAQGMRRFTPATRTDVEALQQELDETAARGWAMEVGELSPGVASLAAPISGGEFAKPGAISIEGSADLLLEDGRPRPELVGALVESARGVARQLGAQEWSM